MGLSKVIIALVILMSLVLFGCTSSSANQANVNLCDKETTQLDKDICYSNLVFDGNFSTRQEALAYCNKIDDIEIKLDCRTIANVAS